MLCSFCCIISHESPIKQGGDYALKRPTFAVVSDLANIAEQLPRDPDPKLIMTLRRAGSNSRKNLTFRPKKIEEALR